MKINLKTQKKHIEYLGLKVHERLEENFGINALFGEGEYWSSFILWEKRHNNIHY